MIDFSKIEKVSDDRPCIPTCPNCGSDDVTRDAVVRWNVQTQEWELAGTFDNSDCGKCGRSGDYLEWIDAPADPARPQFVPSDVIK